MLEHYHTPRDTFAHTSDVNFDRLFHRLIQFIETYEN